MRSRLSEQRILLPRSWSTLATVAVFLTFILSITAFSSSHDQEHVLQNPLSASSKLPKKQPVECRHVHNVADKCAFILENCKDDNEAALVHYLSFYYCRMSGAEPVALFILIFWLALLFSTIGIAASEFFSVNLDTLAKELGMSENLAGVTLLALGNGSPDVFSTFAAMKSNSGSMAVGELIGAACFITAVVAGSMALVREFKVVLRGMFVRDVVFFIVAVGFTMVFLADGRLYIWECGAMILFYLFYVLFVVGSHVHTSRRRRERAKLKAARTQVYGTNGVGTEEFEPYRDDPDDEIGRVGGRSSSAPEPADLSILERVTGGAPRIEVTGSDVPVVPPSQRTDDDEEQRDMHAAAEMTSNMRVLRPRYGRSNTAITPIRPSLVGVLEFRSVLSSLQKERNMRMGNLPERQQPGRGHHRSVSNTEDIRGRSRMNTSPAYLPATSRDRALSHGNPPLNLGSTEIPRPESVAGSAGTRKSSATRTVDGRLAPPTLLLQEPSSSSSRQEPPRLKIVPTATRESSPATSPFPRFSESPALLSPISTQGYPFPEWPSDVRRHSIGIVESAEEPKPVSWWPYRFLPAPHVLVNTLFPTLQGWNEKPIWDKVLGLLSVPSIFLLVITLPVSQSGKGEDEDDEMDADSLPDNDPYGALYTPGIPITPGDGQEWEQFRRRTRSASLRSPRASPSLSPTRVSLQVPSLPGDTVTLPQPLPLTNAEHIPEADRVTVSSEGPPPWNRWLYAVNMFMGPLFMVWILWLNMGDDDDQVTTNWSKTLARMVCYSLLVSLCMLMGLLLTTSPNTKPQLHWIICIFGFIISVFWISTIAGEVVGVLKAVGVILNMSEAILGLTIFAMGNSVGDLVANITIARLGSPIMALAACFGGPMLNILLGVGVGGIWGSTIAANKAHKKHPDRPFSYKPIRIQVGGTLIVSAATVLLTLIFLLVAVPRNDWMMNRKIGYGLIGIWTTSMIFNVAIEIAGIWTEVV
ncbi:Sodium/calcium exchanger protein-domain-containing protein [Podospora fimiseda]|uniref:Sodium/calcium exchanger protein-domain-containing protein n=1 Tax=Podospora fimiseda TaxID=252190 RepID=A0AAN7BVU5_9PEZI|nr:Sodium/calcium exchanger protein-domain-containing protein [Podospora fimiseda]